MSEPACTASPSADVFALARSRDRVEGSIEIAQMDRLAPLLASTEGRIAWCLTGEADSSGRPAAMLALSGRVTLKCDRCGLDVELPIESESRFWFVRTEEELNRVPIDDSETEPLLGSREFAIAPLVEDELIMALPISPRHPQCRAEDEDAAAPQGHRPLADLAALRSRH
jgi:uncharacterized protein